MKNDVKSVINPPRRVPQSLRDELSKTLKDLAILDIVPPVDASPDWISSLAVVEKANVKLKICLDPRNLNKDITRVYYVIPSADEITSKLGGKQSFSVLGILTNCSG